MLEDDERAHLELLCPHLQCGVHVAHQKRHCMPRRRKKRPSLPDIAFMLIPSSSGEVLSKILAGLGVTLVIPRAAQVLDWFDQAYACEAGSSGDPGYDFRYLHDAVPVEA